MASLRLPVALQLVLCATALAQEPAPGSEDAKLFVAPLAEVIRHWQFVVPTDDPAGEVVAVDSSAYPKQRRVNLEAFEKEVGDAMREWKFTPVPGIKYNRRVCYQILFRLRG